MQVVKMGAKMHKSLFLPICSLAELIDKYPLHCQDGHSHLLWHRLEHLDTEAVGKKTNMPFLEIPTATEETKTDFEQATFKQYPVVRGKHRISPQKI